MKKQFKFLPLILLCFLFSNHIWAKQLYGRVVDAKDGAPVAGCAVYINYSTIGTTTGKDGRFTLQYNGTLPADLAFQSVGYESRMVNITATSPEEINISLAVRDNELQEVKVLAPIEKGWARFGKDFLEAFLGYSDWSEQCVLVNKEVLTFRFDKELQTLYVHASAPLIIKHNQLGYIINYDLMDFSRNYKDHAIYFTGSARYEPMVLKSKKKQARVTKNRLESYYGSINHFMRAVYQRKCREEGFVVNAMVRIDGKDYGRYVSLWTDTIDTKNTGDVKRLATSMLSHPGVDTQRIVPFFIALKQWMDKDTQQSVIHFPLPLKDTVKTTNHHYFIERTARPERFTVKYYDYSRLSPQDSMRKFEMSEMNLVGNPGIFQKPVKAVSNMMDIVYNMPLPIDSFRIAVDSPEIALSFKKYLQVTYLLEKEELPYLKRKSPFAPLEPKEQRSVLSLRDADEVLIQENGNYYPPYALFLEGYWSYEKLDKQLPLDYEP
ncbi:carboxypeptidase-like regulatory domain-containing protein [Edaphocola aurantiacus]|uniref:carboxypeptidase-like regulatory domain-containing protein n=1 Tax=Edaphocola aurantiacus TaxID=2601682 RepID=UPI001C968E12|nr:carboxypeptidase-like regulatory domain-containing protein [Edaphocola aurantiacus]